MVEKYYKYAKLLLIKGLSINKDQPLVISAPVSSYDFVRVLVDVATSLDVSDIYIDWYDEEIKHSILKCASDDIIRKLPLFNKEVHNEYAKGDAAFLFLTSSSPDIMKDISADKLKLAMSTSIMTREVYRDKQSNNEIDWCIASVATCEWGKLLFKDSNNPKEDLWNLIFDICLINEDDPIMAWNNKMTKNKELCDKLNSLKIKELHYTNNLGTDLRIGLSEAAIWCGGSSNVKGRDILVNIPTEEVFTTPNKFMTNGIVYTSMPLIHSGIQINDICLEFKDGKVINYSASSGLSELKNIIETDTESCMLGECALVDKNSKIAKTNKLFYETLFDENAACHIALGRGFKECLSNGVNLSIQELENIGYDKSNNHVDMMIGTDDLMITVKTYDNKEIVIFKEGSFNI